jgi:hypothetical protein
VYSIGIDARVQYWGGCLCAVLGWVPVYSIGIDARVQYWGGCPCTVLGWVPCTVLGWVPCTVLGWVPVYSIGVGARGQLWDGGPLHVTVCSLRKYRYDEFWSMDCRSEETKLCACLQTFFDLFAISSIDTGNKN